MKILKDHNVKIETEGYSNRSQWFIQSPWPRATDFYALAPLGCFNLRPSKLTRTCINTSCEEICRMKQDDQMKEAERIPKLLAPESAAILGFWRQSGFVLFLLRGTCILINLDLAFPHRLSWVSRIHRRKQGHRFRVQNLARMMQGEYVLLPPDTTYMSGHFD